MFGPTFKKDPKKFGEIAVEKGLASKEEILTALTLQEEFLSKQKIHKVIGGILIENGVLTPENVKEILEIQGGKIGLFAWFTALFGLSR